jgi:hypothetical protein
VTVSSDTTARSRHRPALQLVQGGRELGATNDKTWQTQDAFLEPLQAWCERARHEVDQGLAGSTRAWSEGRSLKRSDLFKLPPEDAIQVEPDELRKEFLQRLERRARAPRP